MTSAETFNFKFDKAVTSNNQFVYRAPTDWGYM